MKLYIVTVGIGYGVTYQMHFWADDEDHAREQAADALVNLDDEWIESIEETVDVVPFNVWADA